MQSSCLLIPTVLLTVACARKETSKNIQEATEWSRQNAEIATTAGGSNTTIDHPIKSVDWNMAENPAEDDSDKGLASRFIVHMRRFSSGTLVIRLDSASIPSTSLEGPFYPADSVVVSNLAPHDRFTEGCRLGSAPLAPRVGVVSDTAADQWSRPKYIWLLDTVSARIRQIPTDSASCYRAGRD
jgi:hypothetical protein